MTFQRVQEEINWANASVLEAQAAFKAGVGKDTFAYVVEVDPQTGNKAWKIKRVGNTPPEIPHLLRGALLDIKHSFDRMLNVAACCCPLIPGQFLTG